MSAYRNIARANSLYRSGAYLEALDLYEEIAKHHKASWVHANITLCRKKIENSIEYSSAKLTKDSSPEIIITLTTIRSRLKFVPKVIESLLHQTLQPIWIELNISREPYLLDEGIAPDDPILLELMKQPLLRINWVPNIGPYRKIWPFLEGHFSKGCAQEQIFVTVDDDTLYPDYFLHKLYSSYLKHGCVIAFRGRHIEMEGENIAPYDQWTPGQVQPSHKNMPTGKDGILYSTKFFSKNFLDLTEVLRAAPTADDLWIKWHCSLNGVPAVILNPEACTSDFKSFPLVSYEKSDRDNSLFCAHNSPGAQNKNDFSIKELESYFESNLGCNLAWLINNPEKIYNKSGVPQIAKNNDSLPKIIFIENHSEKSSNVDLDTLSWKIQNKYRYVITTGIRLEPDEELFRQINGQGIAILEGVTYAPEIAEAVVALMSELRAQKTLRYRLSLASSWDKITSLPWAEFWLPGAETQARQLDGLMTDKDCAHMNSLKRLRQLLEQQKPNHDRSIFLANQYRRNASVSQGCELFKKKYLSNCHVLNLAHRVDRLKRVNNVFDAMGIQVNRVEAIYGKESPLCYEIFKKVNNQFEILKNSDIAPFRWDFDMYQSYPSEQARNVHFAKTQGKLLSLGSLGYLLSYRKALVQGLCSATDRNDYITIFDDDVLLHSDWKNILEDAYWQLPENPAVIMLGAIQYHWDKGISWFSENIYCCNGTSIASHATVIHKEYAAFLIDEIEKFILPFDIGALHYLKSYLFGRSFVIYPNVLIQETSESDIADTKNQKIVGQTKNNVYRWELEKYKVGLV